MLEYEERFPSHHPQRVKVSEVTFFFVMSLRHLIVTGAPISGVMPSRFKVRVSSAISDSFSGIEPSSGNEKSSFAYWSLA